MSDNVMSAWRATAALKPHEMGPNNTSRTARSRWLRRCSVLSARIPEYSNFTNLDSRYTQKGKCVSWKAKLQKHRPVSWISNMRHMEGLRGTDSEKAFSEVHS